MSNAILMKQEHMQIVMKTDLKKTGDIQSTKTLPQGRRGKITACLFM